MSAPVAVPVVKFNGGETTPDVRSRSDLDWYGASCEILLNAIAKPHGPATMRTGTWHAGTPYVPGGPTSGRTRLLGFVAGVDPLEAYVVECTDQKMRFWIGGSRAIVGGVTPLEVTSPYAAADLPALRIVQSRDVMWVMHPKYRPQKLKRTSPTTFTLTPVDFVDGPYYPMNVTGTTLTAGATTGTVALAASSNLFVATDVGRLVRFGDSGGNWGYGKITAYASPTSVTMQVIYTLPNTGPTQFWRLGLWSDTTGWPACGVFHQERLFYGSNPTGSFSRLDGSATGDFDKFSPGTGDADPVAYVLGAGDLPVVRDLISDRALIAVTSSVELKIGHEQSTAVMTTSNPPLITTISTEGAMDSAALKLKRGTVFGQRYGRSLHEIAYAVDADGLQTRDISVRADHIGDRAPFAGFCWQNRPHNLIWAWSQNGSLSGCTYTPEQSVIAWHRHRMGGSFQGGAARVESMCSIPGLTSDEVWVVVRRTINGQDVRQIGVFADALHANEPPDEAAYLDAGVRQRGTAPAASITFSSVDLVAKTARVTANAAVFSAPDAGKRFYAVLEDLDVEAPDGQLVWRRVEVKLASFVSSTDFDVELVSTWLPPSRVIAQGSWRYGITEITGLDHLEGQQVAILADGAATAAAIVTGGKVTLDYEAATAFAGLAYNMVLQPVPIDAGARAGTARTRRIQVPALGLEVVRSGTFRAGVVGSLYDANVRTALDPMNEAVPLLTGVHEVELPQGEDERRVRWRVEASGPLPVTIGCAVPIQAIGEAAP